MCLFVLLQVVTDLYKNFPSICLALYLLSSFVLPHLYGLIWPLKRWYNKKVCRLQETSLCSKASIVCAVNRKKKLPRLKQKSVVVHAPKHTGPLHFHSRFFFFTLRHVTQTFSPECAHNFWSPWMIVLQERERLQTIAGITNSLFVWFWNQWG